MKAFITFLGKMHSGNDDVSSKRVYNTLFVIQILVMINGAQFFNKPLDFSVLCALLTVVTGLSFLNYKAQSDVLNAKKDVASDMVKATGDNDSAKETMQAAEPSA